MVSGDRPAAERAWLISARTWAAGVAPPEAVADGDGERGAGLGDGEVVAADRAARRLARAGEADSAVGDAGAVATAARKGRPAQEPAGEGGQLV